MQSYCCCSNSHLFHLSFFHFRQNSKNQSFSQRGDLKKKSVFCYGIEETVGAYLAFAYTKAAPPKRKVPVAPQEKGKSPSSLLSLSSPPQTIDFPPISFFRDQDGRRRRDTPRTVVESKLPRFWHVRNTERVEKLLKMAPSGRKNTAAIQSRSKGSGPKEEAESEAV